MAEDQPYAYMNESSGHCHRFTGLDWVLRVSTEVRSHLLLQSLLHQVCVSVIKYLKTMQVSRKDDLLPNPDSRGFIHG